MSGAEALAVVGVIANIVALIDFTSKAISRLKSFSSDVRQLPEIYEDVSSVLLLVSDTVEEVDEQIKNRLLDERRCRSLRPTIEKCEADLEKLKELLEKILPKEGDGGRERLWKAAVSLRKDKKVAEIVRGVSEKIQLVAANYTVSKSLVKRVSSGLSSLSVSKAQQHKTFFLVPFQWSDDFKGREDELGELETRLKLPNKYSRVALVGLGGMGKTRIALEYTRRYKKSSEVSVFWAHASSVDRMRKGMLEIAKKVQIEGWDDVKIEIFPLVKEWLEGQQSGKWLLVVDNADDFDMLYKAGGPRLADWLPRSGNGSILMTTRSEKVGISFATASNVVRLENLAAEDACAMIASKLPNNASGDADYATLAKELEYIPLALVQAAAFISINGLQITEYLDLYRANDAAKIELLSEDFEDEVRDPETRNPIATTWSITFDRLRSQELYAAEVLSLMCVLDTQAIPESLLRGFETNSIRLKKGLGALRSYSLISLRKSDGQHGEGQDPAYDLHRLVGLTTRNWLSLNGSLDQWTIKAIKILADIYPDGEFETRDLWLKYLSHSTKLLSCEKLQMDVEYVSKSYDELMRTCKDSQRLPKVFVNQRSVKEHAPVGVWCPLCTVSLLNKLSNSFSTDGAFRTGWIYGERALVIAVQCLGDQALATLDALDNMANALGTGDDDKGATNILDRVYDLRRSIQGQKDPQTLLSHLNLAWSQVTTMEISKDGKLGEMGYSVSDMSNLVDLLREVNGEDHPDVLRAETALAMTEFFDIMVQEGDCLSGLNKIGKSDANLVKFDDIIEANRRTMGPKHPRTLSSLFLLALTQFARRDFEESEKTLDFILACRMEQTGFSHPETMHTMYVLSIVYNCQERQKDRERILIELLNNRLEFLGKGHKDTIEALNELVECEEEQHPDDIASFKRILKLRHDFLGQDAEDTQQSIAKVLFAEGKKEQSEQILLRLARSHGWRSLVDHDTAIDSLAFWEQHFLENLTEQERFSRYFNLRKELLGPGHEKFLTKIRWPQTELPEQYPHDQAQWDKDLLFAIQTVVALLQGVSDDLHYDALDAIEPFVLSINNLGYGNEVTEINETIVIPKVEKIYHSNLETLGPEHPKTIKIHKQLFIECNFANLYHKTDKHGRDLLVILGKIHEESDAEILKVKKAFAINLSWLGRNGEREELQKQILAQYLRSVGEDHEDTQQARAALHETYVRINDWQKSIEQGVLLVQSATKSIGEDDPQTLAWTASLAKSYHENKDYKEACTLRSRIYEDREKTLGEEHPDTQDALWDLATSSAYNIYDEKQTFESAKFYLAAEAIGKKKVETLQKTFGNDHSDTLMAMMTLAKMYRARSMFLKTTELQWTVLDSRERTFGISHIDTLDAAKDLSRTLLRMGEYTIAEMILTTVLEASEASNIDTYQGTLDTMRWIKDALFHQEKYTDVYAIDKRILKLETVTLGEMHNDVRDALEEVINAGKDAEMWEDIVDYEKQLLKYQPESNDKNPRETIEELALGEA